MSHTPTPWIWDEPSNWLGLNARVCTEKYEPIAQVQLSGWPKKIGHANAEFLCRAANAHDLFVKACTAVVTNSAGARELCEQALAQLPPENLDSVVIAVMEYAAAIRQEPKP